MQLAHQRLGEFVERVRQDDDLEALAQPVDEVQRPRERLQRGDHLLDIIDFQVVLGENAESLLHQHVVIRDVAGGGAQFLDAGALGESDPDFGYEHSFEVETGQFHARFSLAGMGVATAR